MNGKESIYLISIKMHGSIDVWKKTLDMQKMYSNFKLNYSALPNLLNMMNKIEIGRKNIKWLMESLKWWMKKKAFTLYQ